MKVLVACEFSGIVRDAFATRGHDAWSCDLLPSERIGNHIQGNVLEHLGDDWDLMIAHPPCTYLANSGVQYLHKDDSRWEKLREGRTFFLKFLDAPIPKIAVENPLPHSYAKLPDYTQIIEPYFWGDEFSKRTCLWLKNLPMLTHDAEDTLFGKATHVGKGKRYIGKDGKSNGAEWYVKVPAKDRWKIRSRTFPGIAKAMAEQWG